MQRQKQNDFRRLQNYNCGTNGFTLTSSDAFCFLSYSLNPVALLCRFHGELMVCHRLLYLAIPLCANLYRIPLGYRSLC